MKLIRAVILLAAISFLSGCVLTKIITMPMRVGGAVISVMPVLGNPAHDSIDKAAGTVDKIPI